MGEREGVRRNFKDLRLEFIWNLVLNMELAAGNELL
jgi:hypothetical protein